MSPRFAIRSAACYSISVLGQSSSISTQSLIAFGLDAIVNGDVMG
jgi:hypothetical protein